MEKQKPDRKYANDSGEDKNERAYPIQKLRVIACTIPTDTPESDGTLK